MCNQQEKLPIFAYTLKSLVKLQLDYEYEQLGRASQKDYPEEEYNRALEDFSNTRIMKLLYFTCLESVKEKDGKIDIGLFKYFDDFHAYERGPVEVDIYMLLSSSMASHDDVFSTVASELREMIVKAVDGLKTKIKEDTFKLVEWAHQLPLWNRARFDKENEMFINQWTLSSELATYKSLIKKI